MSLSNINSTHNFGSYIGIRPPTSIILMEFDRKRPLTQEHETRASPLKNLNVGALANSTKIHFS